MAFVETAMIPVSKPHLTTEDVEAVKTCIQSGWISQGKRVREFEEAWAAYIGVKHCVMVSSGTTALQLALSALDINHSDEVIIPDLTFAAVANAVIAVGARPVCVDVDRETWNITSKNPWRYAIKGKALIAVHSYGNPCTWMVDGSPLPVIEDCAEAHGATINGHKVGSFGLMSTFSFYANKIITTGEGGCVCTDDDTLNKNLRLLRDHGMSEERYFHTVAGFNYRMTDMQAALGLSQLKRIEAVLKERDAIWLKYDSLLDPLGFKSPTLVGYAASWLYTALCPEHISRDGLAAYLKDHGVETRPMFRPISSFPYINQPRCENAAALSMRGISLPTYNGLTTLNQNKVINLIKQYVEQSTIR